MRKLTQREYVMIGFLAVAGLVAVYFGRGPGLGGGRTAEEEAAIQVGQAPFVDMASLQATAESYDGKGRSLFQYYTPPRAAPPPPPPREKTPPPPPPRRVERKPKPPAQPAKPRPPQPGFTFLGLLGPKENKIAVFEDPEGMVLARSGDVIQEQFRLLEFKYDTVVLGYTDERFQTETTELRAVNR